MTEYKVLTILNLPGTDQRKQPGETVTTEELNQAGQDDGHIQQLLDTGMITEDMEGDVHEDHRELPTPRNMSGHQDTTSITDGDAGEGVSNA